MEGHDTDFKPNYINLNLPIMKRFFLAILLIVSTLSVNAQSIEIFKEDFRKMLNTNLSMDDVSSFFKKHEKTAKSS